MFSDQASTSSHSHAEVTSTVSDPPHYMKPAASTSHCKDPQLPVLETLELLVQVRSKLGVIGETLPLMNLRIKTIISKGILELAAFTSEDQAILKLIRTQLDRAIGDKKCSFIERSILEEVRNQLDKLTVNIEMHAGSGDVFDYKILAQNTEGMSMKEIIDHIYKILKELGKPHEGNDCVGVFAKTLEYRKTDFKDLLSM